MSAPDVVVVGSGVSGLVCARELDRRGLGVVVVERDDAVGGRVRTDRYEGFLLDRGFQVVPTAYPEARRALDLSALRVQAFERGAIVRHEGRFRRVADPRHRPLRGLRTLAGPVVTARDAGAAARLLRGRREETTIAEALEASGLSGPARRAFAEPFLRGITLDPALSGSSRFLTFALRAFSRGPVGLPERGMQAIPDQLAHGLDVRLSAHVAAVGPGVVSLRDGSTISARAVVVAAAGVVDDAPEGWGAVSTISFAAPRAPLAGAWLVLNGTEPGPINDLCVPSEVAPTYAPAGRALVSVTVLSGRDGVDLDAVTHQLEGWFGGAVRRWTHLRTLTVDRALPRYRPGMPLERAPRLTDGLYACGDHRQHPSLDGAMASGRRAAEAVIADLAYADTALGEGGTSR